MTPRLDVRLMPGGKHGMYYGVFLRAEGAKQGGMLIARFGSLDMAHSFIRIYPTMAKDAGQRAMGAVGRRSAA